MWPAPSCLVVFHVSATSQDEPNLPPTWKCIQTKITKTSTPHRMNVSSIFPSMWSSVPRPVRLISAAGMIQGDDKMSWDHSESSFRQVVRANKKHEDQWASFMSFSSFYNDALRYRWSSHPPTDAVEFQVNFQLFVISLLDTSSWLCNLKGPIPIPNPNWVCP